MKKEMVSLFAVSIATLAFAANFDSDNALGALPVSKPAGKAMLAVPFVGFDGGAVNVSEIVATSGLNAGDKLYLARSGSASYECWVLEDGAWKPTTSFERRGSGILSHVSGSAESTKIPRGDALWLETSATRVYLMGQKGSGDSVTVRYGAGWNLIGNSSATAGKTLAVIGNPAAGDIVIFGNGANETKYIYGATSGTWQNMATKERLSPSAIPLPVGEGFWYNTKNSGEISL